jgi:hypothetical protein
VSSVNSHHALKLSDVLSRYEPGLTDSICKSLSEVQLVEKSTVD